MARKSAKSAARKAGPVPSATPEIDAIVRRCRASVKRRAWVAAVAAVVPIPGLDLAVDIGLMMKMMEDINAQFGLTGEQIEALAPAERMTTYAAIGAVGSSLIGRVVTKRALTALLRSVAKRLAAATTVKFVPLAGQAVAAGLSYVALKYVGNRHIEDCVAVTEILARGRTVQG